MQQDESCSPLLIAQRAPRPAVNDELPIACRVQTDPSANDDTHDTDQREAILSNCSAARAGFLTQALVLETGGRGSGAEGEAGRSGVRATVSKAQISIEQK